MSKNEQKLQPLQCYEERKLQSRNRPHELKTKRSGARAMFMKRRTMSQSSVVFMTAPQPWP